MTAITMETLARETARVFDDLAESSEPFVITRDGVPVAHLVRISDFERQLYADFEAMGVDPHAPPTIDRDWKSLPPVAPGEKTATDYLMEDRGSYYEED